jgi:hypothetical protein
VTELFSNSEWWVGLALVIFIGLLMLFDVLYLITVWFPFNTGV